MKRSFVLILASTLILLANPAGAQLSGENLLAGVRGLFVDSDARGIYYKACGIDDEAIQMAQAEPLREAGVPIGSSFGRHDYSVTVDVLMVSPTNGGDLICSAAINFYILDYRPDLELADGTRAADSYQVLYGAMEHVLLPRRQFARAVLEVIRDQTIVVAAKWIVANEKLDRD